MPVHRRITSRTLAHRDRDTALTGMLCCDEAQHETAPGVLLVHGGAGLDDRHAMPGAIAGVAYDAIADERSCAATSEFLANVLGKR
jgi:hypothetical protein